MQAAAPDFRLIWHRTRAAMMSWMRRCASEPGRSPPSARHCASSSAHSCEAQQHRHVHFAPCTASLHATASLPAAPSTLSAPLSLATTTCTAWEANFVL